MIKAFLCALVLTIEELRKLYGLSRTKQQERSIGCIVYLFLCVNSFYAKLWLGMVYIYASAWGFPLLVSTIRAMRRPFYRGTSDRTGFTLFFMCIERINYLVIYGAG